MSNDTQAPAPARALIVATACGSLAALAMGGAYLGGSLMKSVSVQGQAQRLAPAAKAGFANDALMAATGADESALRIAARHDPYTVAGAAARDRQSTLFAARLISQAQDYQADYQQDKRAAADTAGLRKVSFTFAPAAKPFRMGAALDASRDLDCLTDAVYYEARGEGMAGMQAVAQVVLNRARHPAFPKTVCGVVFQGAAGGGCQFSFACDGSMHRAVEPGAWRRAREVAAKALSGYVMTEVGNATHFHTTAVSPGWRSNMLRVAQVGTQIFYRFGGSAGRPDAFSYAPQPSTGGERHQVTVMTASLTPAPVAAVIEQATTAAPAPYAIVHKDAPADAKAPAPAVKTEVKDAPKTDAPAAPPATKTAAGSGS